LGNLKVNYLGKSIDKRIESRKTMIHLNFKLDDPPILDIEYRAIYFFNLKAGRSFQDTYGDPNGLVGNRGQKKLFFEMAIAL